MANATQKKASPIAATLMALAVVGALAWATSFWWLPPISEMIGNAPAEENHADHADHGEINELTLSDEARQTLGIEVRPLSRSPYERIIPIPGRTITVPGVGRAEVTSPSSGVVSNILVREGQMVSPGDPLFEVQLIHDEGIKVQFELLDALAEREVVDVDLKRLQDLEKRSPGTIQGTRILELVYKRRHLNHLIASRRQMLILLGLPATDVDKMIKTHLTESAKPPTEGETDFAEPLLLEKVAITAPVAGDDSANNTRYLVEQLQVVSGQHVESGDSLALLGDYQTLLIEGDGFERDVDAIRQARDKAWPITAAIERRGTDAVLLNNLHISDKALKIDPQSRSAKFYVDLPNKLREIPPSENMKRREEWTFRPGQRMELRMPVERIQAALKVPAAAVAQNGLDNYVFQASGNTFTRRPVEVLYRDEDYAVLAENRYVTDGVPIAMNGAYQLQLALLNKSTDPAAAAHGHAH